MITKARTQAMSTLKVTAVAFRATDLVGAVSALLLRAVAEFIGTQ